MILAILLACAAGPPTVSGVDAYGDPLPDGAVARFGTLRWRAWSPASLATSQVAASPDGKALLVCNRLGLSLVRRADGKPLPGPPNALDVCRFAFIPGTSRVALALAVRTDVGSSLVLAEYTWPAWRPVPESSLTASVSGWPASCHDIAPDGKKAAFVVEGRALVLGVGGGFRYLGAADRGAARAAFGPDGKSVAVVHVDGSARLFSAEGKALRWLRAPAVTRPRECTAAFFSPDGSALFALRPQWAELVRWDTRTGRAIRRRAHGGELAALTPDGKRLFVAGRGVIRVFDAATLRAVRTMRPTREWALAGLAFSPDGKVLLVATGAGVRALNPETGKPIDGLVGHFAPVRHLAFSPDGRWLASGGDDGAVLLWDIASRRQARAFEGHARGVACLAFSPDGRSLAVGDGGNCLLDRDREASASVWDVATGKLHWRAVAHVNSVGSLAFFDGGKAIATAGPDDSVRWWAAADGKALGQDRFCTGARVASGDGAYALIHEARVPDGLWTLGPGDRAPVRLWPEAPTRGRATPVLVAGGKAALVKLGESYGWMDVPSGRVSRRMDLSGLPADLGEPLFSPDRKLVALRGAGLGYFEVFEVESKRRLGRLAGHGGGPTALAFSPDGAWIASAGPLGDVVLWDVGRLRMQAALDDWVGPAAKGLARRPDLAAARLGEALLACARFEQGLPKLVERLADESFEAREKASREAERLGRAALPALLRLRRPADLEARERVRRLLNRFTPEEREQAEFAWARNALAVLRGAGTEDARAALRELARLGGDTLIGREARDALRRDE